MKTTLHYIIAILLLSLNATHAFAEGGEGPFKITNRGDKVIYSYNNEKTLLTISGDGPITITGNGAPVNCGIKIVGIIVLTIKDLNIVAPAPLVYNASNIEFHFYLKGTNILESTAENPGMFINRDNSKVSIIDNGSLKVIGGNGASGIEGTVIIDDNACVVAIGGEGADAVISPAPNDYTFVSGLLISGTKQPGGGIEQDYSELQGDITLGSNLEIPSWATVTIPAGQSITVPEGITLTNKGTLETQEGTLVNKGSIINDGTLETKDGTLVNEGTFTNEGIITNNKFLNIEGEDGFDVFADGDEATFSYDSAKKLLTISGSGNVLLKGKNKDHPVNCGIVIAEGSSVVLTIEDLNIEAPAPLVYQLSSWDGFDFYLKGTNVLESTTCNPGMNLNDNKAFIKGLGSLKVIGGKGAFGIEGTVNIVDNACVVAISGEGADEISNIGSHTSGLLISGTKQPGGGIEQQYSELKDDIILGGNLEIPKGATLNIANGQTFTIAPDVTLTNNGTINNGGTINNKGTLAGNQPQHHITFKANDSGSATDVERYITEGKTLPTDIFTRSGYTFQGWFTDPDGDTKVETVAGVQTLYAQWEADEPAVEPEPPYIPPVPIYYNVYLPQVEGASTDPGPGEYEVESWSTFRFYLTVDSAYSESQPVVTTDRGETLVPRTSDGAYLVKYVRTDVEVFIDGLVQNPPPVANEAIDTDALVPQIWAEGTTLCIRMAEALPSAPVRIFTVDGRLYDSFDSTPGLNRRQLPTGMYIVRIGETASKVIIK